MLRAPAAHTLGHERRSRGIHAPAWTPPGEVKLRRRMADWSTIASLSTAAGTLVLALATFSSVRSSQRTARVAERSLLLGLRPVLVPSRPEDPAEEVRFAEGRIVSVHGGEAAVTEEAGNHYRVIPLRNAGSGLAVLHGWHVRARREASDAPSSTCSTATTREDSAR